MDCVSVIIPSFNRFNFLLNTYNQLNHRHMTYL